MSVFSQEQDLSSGRAYRYDPEEYGEPWILVDMNEDGIIDHTLLLNDEGDRVEEAMDFNKDGFMDVFYFYKKGALKYQHIDTNYDKKIDVWVTLKEGIYIQKYVMDVDFDGKPDITKDYDEE
jgi:hypothetical protein